LRFISFPESFRNFPELFSPIVLEFVVSPRTSIPNGTVG
jgi:hypothetical protein